MHVQHDRFDVSGLGQALQQEFHHIAAAFQRVPRYSRDSGAAEQALRGGAGVDDAALALLVPKAPVGGDLLQLPRSFSEVVV